MLEITIEFHYQRIIVLFACSGCLNLVSILLIQKTTRSSIKYIKSISPVSERNFSSVQQNVLLHRAM